MNSDIDFFQKKLNIRFGEDVSVKAKEYQRLLNGRGRIRIKQLHQCEAAVCVELACQATGNTFPRADALRLLGMKAAPYEKAFNAARANLGVTPNITFSTLCGKHGTENVEALCEQQFRKFQAAYSRLYDKVDCTQPKYIAALYWLCCQYMKVRTKKSEVQPDSAVSSEEFSQAIRDMQEILPELKKQSSNPGSKKRSAPSDATNEDGGAEDGVEASENATGQSEGMRSKRQRADQSEGAAAKTRGRSRGEKAIQQVESESASALSKSAGQSANKNLAFAPPHSTRTPSKLGAASKGRAKTPGTISTLANVLRPSQSMSRKDANAETCPLGVDVSPYADMEYQAWRSFILENIDKQLSSPAKKA